MSKFAEPMARLIEELRKLPGVGTKSAQRLAFRQGIDGVVFVGGAAAQAGGLAQADLKRHAD